jgi:hypothetical protein
LTITRNLVVLIRSALAAIKKARQICLVTLRRYGRLSRHLLPLFLHS